MTETVKYKLLAFCTLVKLTRNNSILQHKDESDNTVACSLNMNYNTYKKYKALLITHGFTKMVGPHLGLLKVADILTLLNDGVVDQKNLKFNKHLLFFKKVEYTTVSFKEIYNTIVNSVILKNIDQQLYNINSSKKELDIYKQTSSNRNRAIGSKDLSSLKRLAKKAGSKNMTTEDYVKSTEERGYKDIVTGKFHVSKMTGFSPTTSSRLLKRLVSDKFITRTVINKPLSTIDNKMSLYELQNIYPKGYIYLSRRYNRFFVCTGSVINITDKYRNMMNYKSMIEKKRIYGGLGDLVLNSPIAL